MRKQRIIHELKFVGDNKKSGKLRTAAYIRVSSDSDDQLNSYTAQFRHYMELINENPEWELANIYADEGVTGTNTDSRDDFQRMITDCEKGRIDLILVKSVSRFARNTKDCIEYIRKVKAYGVTVRFEKENIDTSNLGNELELTMHGLIAEEESHSISKNLRQSYVRRMESGEFNTCRAPLGFSLYRNSLTVNEKEADMVRLIFRLFLSGIGKSAIADTLNNHTEFKNEKTKWTYSSIDYILRNERYMGETILQKRYTSDEIPFTQKINNGEYRKFHVKNSNPRIVEKSTFISAQTLIKKRGDIYKRSNSCPHLFSRKIVCPDCGRHFRRKISGQMVKWVCSYGNEDRSKCPKIRIPESSLIEVSTLLLRKLVRHKKYIIDPMISQLAAVQLRSGRCAMQIYDIDKRIAELEKKFHVIAKLNVKGVLSNAAFSERSNDVDKQLLELRKERSRVVKGDPNEEAIEQLKSLEENLLQYDNDDIASIERFIKKIIIKILPCTDENEILFELPGGLILAERMP